MEIEQVGKVRSLNVHVSMVICLWQSFINHIWYLSNNLEEIWSSPNPVSVDFRSKFFKDELPLLDNFSCFDLIFLCFGNVLSSCCNLKCFPNFLHFGGGNKFICRWCFFSIFFFSTYIPFANSSFNFCIVYHCLKLLAFIQIFQFDFEHVPDSPSGYFQWWNNQGKHVFFNSKSIYDTGRNCEDPSHS